MTSSTSGLPAYGVAGGNKSADTTLIAFDPGGTTGYYWAAFTSAGDIVPHSMSWGQLTNTAHHGQLLQLLEDALAITPHLMLVAEDYRPEWARAQNYIALEYLGIIQGFAQRNLVSLYRQSRDKKDWWTTQRLQRVDFWPRGQRHAQDAARHWLAYASTLNSALQRNLLLKLK